MTTKELMIGDYITFSDVQNDSDCPKLKVVIIDKEDVYASIDGDPAVDVLDPKELAGIPLTPEILEKNGFKKGQYGYYWKEKLYGYMGQTVDATTPIEITYEDGHCVVLNPHIGRIFQGSISYAHELQRTLRLCNIDKEIVL